MRTLAGHCARLSTIVVLTLPPTATLFPYTTLFRSTAEVGPQCFGDPDLGVRNLPQQKVAHAHLPARADQQIRIRLTPRVRSEEHTSELQSHSDLVCRLLLEKKHGWHQRSDEQY